MYLLFYSTYLIYFGPGLSDDTVEIVSDLFLFSHSSLISRLSVSGILYFLFKSSANFKASFFLVLVPKKSIRDREFSRAPSLALANKISAMNGFTPRN